MMTSPTPLAGNPPAYVPSAEARRIVRDATVFDTLALNYTLREPFTTRCLEAGVKAANVTIVGEASWDETLNTLDTMLQRIERHPHLRLATTAAEVREANRAGYMAVVLVTQDAGMIGPHLWRLQLLHRLGVRSIGLSYTSANDYADGCGELRDAGLTFLGREFIATVNELPLILDLSHVGHRSRAEAAALAAWPSSTHANAFAVTPNDRNIKDEVALAIAGKDGMVSVCGLPRSVKANAPTVGDLAEHIAYFARLVGVEHVGIGFDFVAGLKGTTDAPASSVRWRTLRPDIFGTVQDFHTTEYPRGIEAIGDLPNVAQQLIDRGWAEVDIVAVLGGNWLAYMDRAIDRRLAAADRTGS